MMPSPKRSNTTMHGPKRCESGLDMGGGLLSPCLLLTVWRGWRRFWSAPAHQLQQSRTDEGEEIEEEKQKRSRQKKKHEMQATHATHETRITPTLSSAYQRRLTTMFVS